MHLFARSNATCHECRYGSDRSSVYVGLSILVQQIKRERRCDVFTAVRKLRAQRQAMIQHLVSPTIASLSFYSVLLYFCNKTDEIR